MRNVQTLAAVVSALFLASCALPLNVQAPGAQDPAGKGTTLTLSLSPFHPGLIDLLNGSAGVGTAKMVSAAGVPSLDDSPSSKAFVAVTSVVIEIYKTGDWDAAARVPKIGTSAVFTKKMIVSPNPGVAQALTQTLTLPSPPVFPLAANGKVEGVVRIQAFNSANGGLPTVEGCAGFSVDQGSSTGQVAVVGFPLSPESLPVDGTTNLGVGASWTPFEVADMTSLGFGGLKISKPGAEKWYKLSGNGQPVQLTVRSYDSLGTLKPGLLVFNGRNGRPDDGTLVGSAIAKSTDTYNNPLTYSFSTVAGSEYYAAVFQLGSIGTVDKYGFDIIAKVTSGLALTYDGNGADGGVPPVSVTAAPAGPAVAVSSTPGTLTKANSTFAGWVTSKAGPGVTYGTSSTPSITLTHDQTLYAVWMPSPLTFTSDGNALTVTGPASASGVVTIPQGVTAIAANAFQNDSGLTGVTFPGTLVSIGTGAFQNTALTSVTLPAAVQSVGNGAFQSNASLTSVTLASPVPPTLTSSDDFGTAAGLQVFVPFATLGAYQTAPLWSVLQASGKLFPTTYQWTVQANSLSTNWTGVASNADGTKLAAVSNGGGAGEYLYLSDDGGATWVQQAAQGKSAWAGVTCDATGNVLVAGTSGLPMQVSANRGAIWTSVPSITKFCRAALTPDGTKMVAVEWGGKVWRSTDSGATWTALTLPLATSNWADCSISDDGQKIFVGDGLSGTGKLYLSIDGGATWTIPSAGGIGSAAGEWTGARMSREGRVLAACSNDGSPKAVWISHDAGSTWGQAPGLPTGCNWKRMAVSPDGMTLVAVNAGGQVWVSRDEGFHWFLSQGTGALMWQCVALSADGNRVILGVYGGGGKLRTGVWQ